MLRDFDINELTEAQIEDTELDMHLIAIEDPVVEILEDAGFNHITDDEYDCAFLAIRGTLERVNEMLRSRGVNLEFCEVDMVDASNFICTRHGESANDFADRIFN